MTCRRTRLPATALVLLLAACEHSHTDDHAHDPNTEACAHYAKGGAVKLTAATTASTSAPLIGDHDPHEITLPGQTGYVTFKADAAAEHYFFTDANVTVKLTNAQGATVDTEGAPATSIKECTAVKGRHVYDLAIGTYVVELKGADKVTVVIEAHEH